MPKPIPDSLEDKALWARAEQLTEDLLNDHDRAIAAAIDDAFCHKQALLKGEAADSDYSERLFLEAQSDLDLGIELAERVWSLLHTRLAGD